MNSQKKENILNLALDTPESERRKTDELDVGYDEDNNTWTLIVRYTGSLDELQKYDAKYVELIGGYGIIEVKEEFVDEVAALEMIQYVEKPKNIFFEVVQGKRASCINPVQTNPLNLSGKGIIVAVIDSGIDYTHPDFIDDNGNSRIISIWDQSVNTGAGVPPLGYNMGREYNNEQINLAIKEENVINRNNIVPSMDYSGHGTAVASVAAGNGRDSDGRNAGVAYNSDLLIVKLATPGKDGFNRTSELMQAIDYCVKKSIELNKPMALNLSFGNTYGSHSGTSLLETYIDDVANVGRSSISVGSGNEGDSAGHTSGDIAGNSEIAVELAIADFEASLSLQIWKAYSDEFEIILESPSKEKKIVLGIPNAAYRTDFGNTRILGYYGEPSPYSRYQEIYFEFVPLDDYIESGIWNIIIRSQKVVVGRYDMWLPSNAVINKGTAFLNPTVDTTLTIPSTAAKVITVGAYNSRTNAMAPFSGRGYTRQINQVKPDIVAPGVDIICASPGGGYTMLSGTSIATPFVTGSAALLMEWGIIKGNDAYFYGEKLKENLIKGANPVGGLKDYPNPRAGFGALCVRNSLPIL